MQRVLLHSQIEASARRHIDQQRQVGLIVLVEPLPEGGGGGCVHCQPQRGGEFLRQLARADLDVRPHLLPFAQPVQQIVAAHTHFLAVVGAVGVLDCGHLTGEVRLLPAGNGQLQRCARRTDGVPGERRRRFEKG